MHCPVCGAGLTIEVGQTKRADPDIISIIFGSAFLSYIKLRLLEGDRTAAEMS